jgi:type III restriction enzyme
MIETKKEADIETSDVQEKTEAALLYCNNASEFTTQNGGKPWKYILIPHNAVMVNMSFKTLARVFEVRA